jgi:uncharacterized protein (TIGR00251 family)
VTVRVRVQPRSSREQLAGVRDGALVVKLTAPPVEGEANAALVSLLAKVLGVPRGAVTLRHGARGRDKTLHIAGLDVDTARARLLPSA